MSHPVRGKHVSFDGRFLHGAPAQLAPLTQQQQQQQQQKQQQEQTSLPPPPPPPLQQPSSAAIETSPSYVDKHDISNTISNSSSSSGDELVNDEELRVTFLVNIWLNHHPAGIGSLPEEIRSGDPPFVAVLLYTLLNNPLPAKIREDTTSYHHFLIQTTMQS